MTSRPLHRTRHDGKHDEQQVIDCSRHRVSSGKYSLIERPRTQKTNPNPATSMRSNAMQPIPSRADHIIGTDRRRTVQRAATMVTTSTMGISISSAVLVPTRGTTHSVRMAPSTKPNREHECEIEYARLQHLHHRVPPSLADDNRSRFSQHHSTINSLTTKSDPKIALLWIASQFGR